VLANANLALAKGVSQPARNHGHNSLVIPNVRFVHTWHGRVANLMRHNSEQVARDGVRMEVDHPFLKICHAFAQFLGRRTLHLYDPPFAVELEAQRWPLAAPAWVLAGFFI
jgi:hypothetical protein